MQVGVFLTLFWGRSFEDALDRAAQVGCSAVEIPCGGYVDAGWCRPADLLDDRAAQTRLFGAVQQRGLAISALSCHGNALHPNHTIAQQHDQDFRNTVRLAAELGVGVVVTFAGCPGDSATSERPNWVTCAWPSDYAVTLEWQWAERVAPYWHEAARFAREQGVRVAIEPHPGFVVYNTASFRRLQQLAGPGLGVNFDPSHLFWQQMDPLACIRELGRDILHVHAKDVALNPRNIAVNGVLDPSAYANIQQRSWRFRTVGDGHDVTV